MDKNMRKAALTIIGVIIISCVVIFAFVWQGLSGNTSEKIFHASLITFCVIVCGLCVCYFGELLVEREVRKANEMILKQRKKYYPGCENGKFPDRCRYMPHQIRAPGLMVHPRPAPSA